MLKKIIDLFITVCNTESSIRGRFNRGLGGGAKPPNIRPFVGKSHYAGLEARKTGITKCCFLTAKKENYLYIKGAT